MREMAALRGRMFDPAGITASLASYRARPTDVILSPFRKCGTTWLQQAFHTLRTGGDMDFDDISRVVPWIETASLLGVDLESPQRAHPRGFKSHLPWTRVPRGARYVVSLRDPRDAFVSLYRFLEGWFFEPGAISYAQFLDGWIRDDGSDYWTHVTSWWSQRDNPDVLLLSYEHMTTDAPAAIRRLAAFCGLPLDGALLALAVERCSLAYMLRHKDRFDDLLYRTRSEAVCELPPGSSSAKVRTGVIGGHRTELPPAVAARIDAVWKERVEPAIGFADYAALEASLRARHAGR